MKNYLTEMFGTSTLVFNGCGSTVIAIGKVYFIEIFIVFAIVELAMVLYHWSSFWVPH